MISLSFYHLESTLLRNMDMDMGTNGPIQYGHGNTIIFEKVGHGKNYVSVYAHNYMCTRQICSGI